MENLSRYVEFCDPNFSVYSIELAHLLFAAASEVDVVAKALCELLDVNAPRENINNYRALIPNRLPEFANETVSVARYGLTLDPWESWRRNANPLWWRSYNNVKHRRHEYFQEANLTNALNGLAALLVTVFYYYRECAIRDNGSIPRNKDVTRELEPQPALLRLREDYYFSNIIF